MASVTSVTSQLPTISTNMASTVENHEQPSHTLREEIMGHTAEKVHQATSLLDKLLARSATLHQRLDSLITPVSPSFGSRKVQPDPGVRPGDILDSCKSSTSRWTGCPPRSRHQSWPWLQQTTGHLRQNRYMYYNRPKEILQ